MSDGIYQFSELPPEWWNAMICVCGHKAGSHHTQIGPAAIGLGECLWGGCNEEGGLAPTHRDGSLCLNRAGNCRRKHEMKDHCFGFREVVS